MHEFYTKLEELTSKYHGFEKDGARFLIDLYAEQCTDENEKKAFELLSNVLYAFANGDDVEQSIEILLNEIRNIKGV